MLIPRPKSIPLEGRPQNPVNGSDAESFAMARVLLACRGEGFWGSREEDGAKIDLVFSCAHPWASGERLFVLAQVKSGPSYGNILQSGFELKRKAKEAALRTTHDVCVVWVDRAEARLFWAYVHPTATAATQQYGAHHEVSPAMLYDLARVAASRRSGATGGNGVTVRRRHSSVTGRRRNVKSAYRDLQLYCPVLGNIEATRVGWRHMFRKGRSRGNKATSLELIPYLGILLKQWPTAHAITSSTTKLHKGMVHRTCEHLVTYDRIKIQSKSGSPAESARAFVRVIEEICYPQRWDAQAMLSQLVARRVVLRSAYIKSHLGG